MSDPNVTEPVTFTGRDGSKVTLHADYGALVICGAGAALEGEVAVDFVGEAAAILVEARKREAKRLRDEEPPVAECSYCTARITLLGGSWTADDGTTACTDTSAPYVPHKPKEG